MWDQMLLGIQTAFTLQNMFFAALGCFIGTIIGMLPGLGPMSVVAIMIPVSIQIGDPSTTLILLAGVYYGAIFGGSTSSILINAPGELRLHLGLRIPIPGGWSIFVYRQLSFLSRLSPSLL